MNMEFSIPMYGNNGLVKKIKRHRVMNEALNWKRMSLQVKIIQRRYGCRKVLNWRLI